MAYWRMRRKTENYRKTAGLPYKEVPDELIEAEEVHVKLEAEIKRLKDSDASEEAIAEKVVTLGVHDARYRRLLAEFESK